MRTLVLALTTWNCALVCGESRMFKDVEYARIDGHVLMLDLYLTQQPGRPLIVWVHGGAWRSGSKDQVPILGLREKGYNIASVEYRLSPVAKFPAQIHDIKGAIRFLRAKSPDYDYDPTRIAIVGASAGGHLAALVGVTGGHADLEGAIGEHRQQSSAVQAIVDLYGPTDLLTILDQSTPHGLSVRIPALNLLLGGLPNELPELGRLASPVMHVDAGDPPLLLIHGDQDPQVPINQSHELHGRYKALYLPVEFEVIHGGAHGGEAFYDDVRLQLIDSFLKEFLAPKPK